MVSCSAQAVVSVVMVSVSLLLKLEFYVVNTHTHKLSDTNSEMYPRYTKYQHSWNAAPPAKVLETI